MTIGKADSADVDIVIVIDDDDTTANNDINEMTNDITIEIEADTDCNANDNTADSMTNGIRIELDEEAPPVVVEQEQQPPPLPDLPWWKKMKNIIQIRLWERSMLCDPRVLFFIIIISLIILFACRGRVGDGVLAAMIFFPFYILIWVAIFELICGCANRDRSSFYDNHFGRSSIPNTTNQSHPIEFPSPLES